MPSIDDLFKLKKTRGRPRTGIGPALGVRLYADMEEDIAAWIKRQPPNRTGAPLTRPEAIRQLIAMGLEMEKSIK